VRQLLLVSVVVVIVVFRSSYPVFATGLVLNCNDRQDCGNSRNGEMLWMYMSKSILRGDRISQARHSLTGPHSSHLPVDIFLAFQCSSR
jgi:hypothetical protein